MVRVFHGTFRLGSILESGALLSSATAHPQKEKSVRETLDTMYAVIVEEVNALPSDEINYYLNLMGFSNGEQRTSVLVDVARTMSLSTYKRCLDNRLGELERAAYIWCDTFVQTALAYTDRSSGAPIQDRAVLEIECNDDCFLPSEKTSTKRIPYRLSLEGHLKKTYVFSEFIETLSAAYPSLEFLSLEQLHKELNHK